MENSHKGLKIFSIIIFVLASLMFCVNTYFFGLAMFTDDLGKAILIMIGFFIPLVAIPFSIISLIVNAIGSKKLKLCKIFTIISIVYILAQLVYIVVVLQ